MVVSINDTASSFLVEIPQIILKSEKNFISWSMVSWEKLKNDYNEFHYGHSFVNLMPFFLD